VSGYSDDYKNDLVLNVSGYYAEKRFLDQDKKIFQWKANNSGSNHNGLIQIPVNGTIDVICDLTFDDIKVIDNYGQSKKEDPKKPPDSSEIKQDVSFVIEVSYSRFNQN
jgi:hypothetical protein